MLLGNMETATNGTNALTFTRMEIPVDPGGDGIPNELDLDSNNDGIGDANETIGSTDVNGDRIVDD